MYKNSLSICSVLLLVLWFSACSQRTMQQEQQIKNEKTTALVGNDKDDHGCIASAGYQWSELLQDCIRPFEKGVKLAPVESDKDALYVAYLVFNSDTSKVEIYLPKVKQRPVLEKASHSVWGNDGNDSLVVRHIGEVWNLYQGEKLLYTSKEKRM